MNLASPLGVGLLITSVLLVIAARSVPDRRRGDRLWLYPLAVACFVAAILLG